MRRSASGTRSLSGQATPSTQSPVRHVGPISRKASLGPNDFSTLASRVRIGVQTGPSASGFYRYPKSRDVTQANYDGLARTSRQNKSYGMQNSLIVKTENREALKKATKDLPYANLADVSAKTEESNVKMDIPIPTNGSQDPINAGKGTKSPIRKSLGKYPASFERSAPKGEVILRSPLTRASSPPSISLQVTPSNMELPHSPVSRSPIKITANKRWSEAKSNSFTVSPTSKPRSTRSRLLEDLDTKPVLSHRPIVSKLHLGVEAISPGLDDAEVTSLVKVAKSDSTQEPHLKEMLQDPEKAGTELTVSQFRRLESNCLSDTRKSCLKASNFHNPNSAFVEDPVHGTVDNPKQQQLKRSVSFSENVVMFVYQA